MRRMATARAWQVWLGGLLVGAFGLCWSTPEALAVQRPDEVAMRKLVRGPAKFRSADAPPEAPPAAVLRDDTELGELPGAPQTEAAIIEALQAYLGSHPDQRGGVSLGQLKRTYVSTIPDPASRSALTYVQFVQQYDGLEVEGSYAHFVVKALPGRTVLLAARAQLYPTLVLRPARPRSSLTIRALAATGLGVTSAQAKPPTEARKLRYLDGAWRRVRELRFDAHELKAVVDEDTGETWAEDDRVYAGIHGRTRGRGVRFDPRATGSNLVSLPLRNLRVNTSSGLSTFTSAGTGSFTFPTQTTSTTVSALLQGLWARVFSNTSSNLSVSGLGIPGSFLTLLLNPAGAEPRATAQVNGYYHTTFIHDWVKPRLLSSLPSIDLAIPVTVNKPFEVTLTGVIFCNAYYRPSDPSLTFFDTGIRTLNGTLVTCINSAYDTIIYHEYGHFVDAMAGRITDKGLSEGWGDVLASFASNQPKIGEQFFKALSDFSGAAIDIRSADNTYQYNALDEIHDLGQAWAGFAWDLRKNLIARLGSIEGRRAAEDLVIPTFLANSADIPSAVYDVLLLDDDDGTLANTSPHMEEIAAAARGHSIPWKVIVPAQIISPRKDAVLHRLNGSIDVFGTTIGSSYRLSFGRGTQPTSWTTISSGLGPRINAKLATWSIAALPLGDYTLRLSTLAAGVTIANRYVHVVVQE